MIRITLALLLTAVVAGAEDSPLVALAKRTNRAASKTPVITNETLARTSGSGKVSFGTGAPLPLPNVPGEKKKAEGAAPKQATVMSTSSGTPYSSARNIQPQSSARNLDPQSGARTINPSVGARNVDAQSTARNLAPSTSAQNIPPQAAKPPQ